MTRGVRARDLGLDVEYYRDWITKREEARRYSKKVPLFVTVSREFGCEGFEVAVELTKKLKERRAEEWTFFTRRMIDEMLADKVNNIDAVAKITSKPRSYKDWFVDAIVPDYMKSSSSQLFDRMRNTILNLADQGNCVILGSGSQIITNRLDYDRFHGIHIRVVANKNWRIRRTAEIFELSIDEATKKLNSEEGLREKFVSDFTGISPLNPDLYHITFNNMKSDAEVMSETIYRYVELKKL